MFMFQNYKKIPVRTSLAKMVVHVMKIQTSLTRVIVKQDLQGKIVRLVSWSIIHLGFQFFLIRSNHFSYMQLL